MVTEKNLEIKYPYFGTRFKIAMQDANLDLKQLSRKTGINYEMLRRYEHGYAMPRQEKLELLAEFLNVQPSWLQFGDDKSNEKPNHEIQEYCYTFPISDGKTKQQAFEIIQQYGMTPEQVFNLILHEIAATKKIPLHFDYLHSQSE